VAFDVKSYEGQARISVLLAVGGAVLALATGALIWQNFSAADFAVYYRPSGMRYLAILSGGALAVILSVTGFFVGLNSAGQRRNKKDSLAWLGFFLNAAVIILAMSLLVFFWFAKFAVA
jgi:hypothetical protein